MVTMEFQGIKGSIFRFSEYVMMIAYLNVLWIMFTLLGGVILGIHPATTALFTGLKRWREEGLDQVTFQHFKKDFKQSFKGSNVLGIFITVLVALLLFNGMLVYTNKEVIHPALIVVYMISMLLATVLLLYVYPVYIHYKMPAKTTITYALIIGMAHPFVTILLVIMTLLFGIVIYSTAGLSIFFGVSVIAFFIMKFSLKVFNKLEEKSILKSKAELSA